MGRVNVVSGRAIPAWTAARGPVSITGEHMHPLSPNDSGRPSLTLIAQRAAGTREAQPTSKPRSWYEDLLRVEQASPGGVVSLRGCDLRALE